MQEEKHTILFDGECALCAYSVRFVSRRDKQGIFNYIPLQSSEAKALTGSEKNHLSDPGTVIYVQKGRFYYRSEAAIRILMKIGGFYRLSAIFLAVPRKLRDFVYSLVARNRHRWFRKNDNCSIEANQ